MKVLVIVDMQNDFTTGVLGNEQCVAAIPQVVSVLKENTYDHIFVTRDTHGLDYLSSQEGQKLPVPHCVSGTLGWELVPELKEALAPFSRDNIVTILDKMTFGSIDLAVMLRSLYNHIAPTHDTLEIEFCGVCTGICVISNALLAKAFVPEAHISVIERACACVTPESHKTALDAMKTCQIDII